ncbi:MAG: permease [Magnetococcus sp. DMHC-6]
MALFLDQLLSLLLEISPWLIFGLLAAGLVKAWVPETLISRWLGGSGMGSITRGALIGTPLPLCSCSVIPMAMGLYRKGASKPATISFLVATPETGIDSIALSWVLLGPFMTLIRPVSAMMSAIFSGVLILIFAKERATSPLPQPKACIKSCCGVSANSNDSLPKPTHTQTLKYGIAYAMGDMWDDLALWLMGGVVVTAAVMTWIPQGELTDYVGGGVALHVEHGSGQRSGLCLRLCLHACGCRYASCRFDSWHGPSLSHRWTRYQSGNFGSGLPRDGGTYLDRLSGWHRAECHGDGGFDGFYWNTMACVAKRCQPEYRCRSGTAGLAGVGMYIVCVGVDGTDFETKN